MPIALGVGTSQGAESFEVGEEAAQRSLQSLGGTAPDLVFVFASIRFADARMLAGVRSVTGSGPLIGCSDAGSFSSEGFHRRSVLVISFKLPGVHVVTALAAHLSSGTKAAGQLLGKAFRDASVKDPQAIFLFPDGLAGNGGELVRSLEKSFGASIPILGSAAADDCFFQKTLQFFNDQVLTDSVPSVLLGGPIAVGTGVRHGWMPVGRPKEVSRAEGHVIHQLDGRPAVSIYEDYLGLRKPELMEEPLARMALTYPLGTPVRGYPEYLIRDAIHVGKKGSLICNADIPEGAVVRLMIGGSEFTLDAAQQAALEAVEQIGRSKLRGVLVFLNVARLKRQGNDSGSEMNVIRNALGQSGRVFAGFYGYGEMAPIRGKKTRRAVNEFMGESAVVVALG